MARKKQPKYYIRVEIFSPHSTDNRSGPADANGAVHNTYEVGGAKSFAYSGEARNAFRHFSQREGAYTGIGLRTRHTPGEYLQRFEREFGVIPAGAIQVPSGVCFFKASPEQAQHILERLVAERQDHQKLARIASSGG